MHRSLRALPVMWRPSHLRHLAAAAGTALLEAAVMEAAVVTQKPMEMVRKLFHYTLEFNKLVMEFLRVLKR